MTERVVIVVKESLPLDQSEFPNISQRVLRKLERRVSLETDPLQKRVGILLLMFSAHALRKGWTRVTWGDLEEEIRTAPHVTREEMIVVLWDLVERGMIVVEDHEMLFATQTPFATLGRTFRGGVWYVVPTPGFAAMINMRARTRPRKVRFPPSRRAAA